MFPVVAKRELAPDITLMEIEAPLVARKIQPGQFLILKVSESGERIPLTMVDRDPERGTVTIVFHQIGKTTRELGRFEVGESIPDLIGPLGNEMPIQKYGRVAIVGGGLGIVPVYPIAKGLKAAGNEVLSIIGARSKSLLIFEDEMRAVSDKLAITTDDGSYGRKGYVADELRDWLAAKEKIDLVVAVGPLPMMRACAEVTRPFGVKTLVSLESNMVDGTGMCGACRITLDGKTKFTCVDGPIFDGHLLDYDELAARKRMYTTHEQHSLQRYKAGDKGGCKCRK